MPICTKIKRQFYQDSLKLMRVSAQIKEMEGVEQAFAFMATEINKKTRMQAGLISDEIMAAGADDLVLIVKGENEKLAAAALEAFEVNISSANAAKDTEKTGKIAPATFEEGYTELTANLAVISVPGPYAALQAMRALQAGMNVQLFSDNVSIEEEIAIKDLAKEKDLLVMGPDCGTSIISGVPICFANKVRGGNIGVVGASGTGLQEFTVLLDAAGCGISHAIGTGGRDLSEIVAGRTALDALELLAGDSCTDIIAVVSKPPARSAADKIIEAIRKIGKPAVLAFLGQKSERLSDDIYIAGTVEEAAAKTVALFRSQDAGKASFLYARKPLDPALLDEIKKLTVKQKQVKGLYTGGTLASEARLVLKGCDHIVIDLGDDEYPRQRAPHDRSLKSYGVHFQRFCGPLHCRSAL
ncbi:MAG: Succinyl-CoA ligase (ADP-forming) subunit alpha [Firmicutes bacterium ADurb.Bin182]|nr:MAG: Succinyl-CoA ligase (ADP-forming) subunit alpha [Firmicutes bacterium ADurb.Bin182]